MQNKYISLLGLARRAGRLAMGHDTVLDSVKTNKSELVLFTADSSPRLRGEIGRAAEEKNIPCLEISEGMDDIHFLIGSRAAVISVNDKNFSNRISELIKQEGNEHGD